ncbi:hypothetical protein ACP4OV_009352 [Aristida adscensionis]
MGRSSRGVRFVSSGVKLPVPSSAPAPAPTLLSAALPFAHIGRAIDAAARRLGAALPRIPIALADAGPPPPPRRHGKDGGGGGGGGEERVLISEVAVRGKDGEPLERPELEAAAAAARRACRPNAALTVREVQEDVHRVVESGLFRSCMPVAIDTRDGIRLVFEVEPNQDFHGLVCEGANMLPSKFLQDAFRDRHGKIINIRHLDQVIKSVNGWYQERGLIGLIVVSYAEILSGGILRLQVSETEVNNINIRFLDKKTGEPTVGKTKPEIILQQLTTKKGQVMAKESSRAIWNSMYEKGLVDILIEHNLNPRFKGQNGWVTEGWRSIASKFNEGFPLAHFTKQQIQEKEKELKGNYKAIRDARKESGGGWNDSLGMIIAVDEVWSRIINAHPKVKKFRGKPFPLFNNLALLYEGSVATGDLNFTSTQRMDIPVEKTISQQDIQLLPRTSEPNDNIDVGRNPFSTSFSGQGASSEHLETHEAQSVQSNQSSGHEDGKGGKKRKESQVASVLGDYLEFKKDQSTSTLEDLKEKKRREEEFSVANCVDALEAMDDLTDEQKADALELFKCDLNRQLFIKTKNPNVRRIWLMKRIAP